MAATVVNGSTPFGGMSNKMIEDIYAVDAAMKRLAAAVATAASGYGGTAGTEYETGSNFGVVPSDANGTDGAAWAYAINVLSGEWATFMTAAQASLNQLDNG